MRNEATSPGVARQLVTFLVLPRKVTKRNRPRFAAPAGFPRSAASKRGCATRPGGAHTPRPIAGLEQCSPLRLLAADRSGAQGKWAVCKECITKGYLGYVPNCLRSQKCDVLHMLGLSAFREQSKQRGCIKTRFSPATSAARKDF